jgi:NAD(P)-dependent dehydrogenase (short-subunit alcohol dehydrogenase family)
MKTIVITGSTRGIGHGLAEEFLKQGCQVVISGRRRESVDKAVAELAARHAAERLLGRACDVSALAEVQALWETARERFGRVDVWINNAGITNPHVPLAELDEAAVREVVNTNLIGAIHGCQVALRGMREQGGGQIYNMEGFGSDGRIGEGLALYGSTKAALRYLTRSLVRETRDTPVQVCFLSPGMVMTDLWEDLYRGQPDKWAKTKRIVNILGDRVETVTPWLAARVLANDKAGAHIQWLTNGKAFGRFLSAPFKKRDLFAEAK